VDIRLKNAQVRRDKIPMWPPFRAAVLWSPSKRWRDERVRRKRKSLKPVRGSVSGCYSFISGGVFNWFNTQYPFSAAEVRAFADATVHLLTMASDIARVPPTSSNRFWRRNWTEDGGHPITSADTSMTPQADLGSWKSGHPDGRQCGA